MEICTSILGLTNPLRSVKSVSPIQVYFSAYSIFSAAKSGEATKWSKSLELNCQMQKVSVLLLDCVAEFYFLGVLSGLEQEKKDLTEKLKNQKVK